MTHELGDQDEDLVAALRALPPADPAVRSAHLDAAMEAWDSVPPREVIPFVGRRRPLLSFAAAAVVLLSLGSATGWALRGQGHDPAVSDQVPRNSIVVTTTALPAKGSDTTPPPCAARAGTARYVGTYEHEGATYVVFATGTSLDTYVKDTCALHRSTPHSPAP